MKKVGYLFLALISLWTVSCCCPAGPETPEIPYEHVMILYSVGRNSIEYYLKNNINQLKGGYVPEKDSRKAIVVVGNFYDGGVMTSKSSPFVARIYKDGEKAVMDTVRTFSTDDRLTSSASMDSILRYVRDAFKSESYGMVYSSHGTGWLPEGYYSTRGNRKNVSQNAAGVAAHIPEGAHIYVEEEPIPGKPAVRSAGNEIYRSGGLSYSYEMAVQNMAKALPFTMEYIIFDACFMGGVEVAYELKEKCGTIVFSAAEVIVAGMDYDNMGQRLLEGSTPDVKGVAVDYYNKYKDNVGVDCSATVSVVDCSKISALVPVCSELFSKYREEIRTVRESTVQGFFVNEDKWFYDLEDILVQSGASSTDLGRLRDALSSCVIYKAATHELLGERIIRTYCGFSTYLPNQGTEYLDGFYKTFQWNIATGFVE